MRPLLLSLVIMLLGCGPATAQQRLSDLLLRLERLQQEVQQLRGQVELQQHELSQLKRRQREQYLDLEARMQKRWAPPTTLAPTFSERKDAASRANRSQAASTISPPPAPDETTSGQTSASEEPASEEKQAYLIAFDLLKQRRYDDAVQGFEDLLASYPNGEFADNARYWLGETRYVKRDHAAALTDFQRVLANYPLSPKVPGAMLKIGYIHSDQGNWRRARSALGDVIKKFPDSEEARLAEKRLARMKREGH